MIGIGTLLMVSRAPFAIPYGWRQNIARSCSWRTFFGGALGALLLSTSAQANPFSLIKTPLIHIANETILTQLVDGSPYFYGEADQPDQLGATYLVFTEQDSHVTGAVFMPHSSFDCFAGRIGNHDLSLQITNSYTQESYDYTIALADTNSPIAGVNATPTPLQLDGFFNLGAARAAELSMLEVCQADGLPQAESSI